MTEPTQADRDAANDWEHLISHRYSEYEGDVLADLTADFTAHRELGQREGRELERAEIVAWLRSHSESCEHLAQTCGDPMLAKAYQTVAITYISLADAIECGVHKLCIDEDCPHHGTKHVCTNPKGGDDAQN